MICVSIAHMFQVSQAVESGAELIELRLDLINEDPARIYQGIPEQVKTIATYRPGKPDSSQRITWLKSCMELGATYIDIEVESTDSYLNTLTGYARKRGTEVVISYHNFEHTPERMQLESMLLQCYERGGDVAKIAVQVTNIEDVRNLLSLYDLPGRKVVLGMGEQGRISRVVGPYLGAEFTFAIQEKGEETAPGQLTMKQLIDIYKVIDES